MKFRLKKWETYSYVTEIEANSLDEAKEIANENDEWCDYDYNDPNEPNIWKICDSEPGKLQWEKYNEEREDWFYLEDAY